MPEEKPSQSISISGGSVFGQVGIGNGATFIQQGNQNIFVDKPLTSKEVTGVIIQIEELLKKANLLESEKKTASKYLDAAKEEVKQKEPDKQLVAKNLKRMSETIKAVKEIWDNVHPLITSLVSWLGVPGNFFGR